MKYFSTNHFNHRSWRAFCNRLEVSRVLNMLLSGCMTISQRNTWMWQLLAVFAKSVIKLWKTNTSCSPIWRCVWFWSPGVLFFDCSRVDPQLCEHDTAFVSLPSRLNSEETMTLGARPLLTVVAVVVVERAEILWKLCCLQSGLYLLSDPFWCEKRHMFRMRCKLQENYGLRGSQTGNNSREVSVFHLPLFCTSEIFRRELNLDQFCVISMLTSIFFSEIPRIK